MTTRKILTLVALTLSTSALIAVEAEAAPRDRRAPEAAKPEPDKPKPEARFVRFAPIVVTPEGVRDATPADLARHTRLEVDLAVLQ